MWTRECSARWPSPLFPGYTSPAWSPMWKNLRKHEAITPSDKQAWDVIVVLLVSEARFVSEKVHGDEMICGPSSAFCPSIGFSRAVAEWHSHACLTERFGQVLLIPFDRKEALQDPDVPHFWSSIINKGSEVENERLQKSCILRYFVKQLASHTSCFQGCWRLM